MPEIHSALSTWDETSVTVRGRDLTTEIMGELDFGATFLLLVTGELPDAGEARLANAMLDSLMVHGMTAHAAAARLTYRSDPSLQGAVASGLLGVGSNFVGSMTECAEVLQAVNAAESPPAAVQETVDTYRDAGDPFPGIGHRFHDPVDPRAERVLEIAADAGVSGPHVDHLRAIQDGFEDRLDFDLPINITGAIAAACSDMGLSPSAARGFAIVSRAGGLVAEVLEEEDTPVAGEIVAAIEEHYQYTGPSASQ
ncbi:MAG: citryl-CoA lyase [Salinirussus sp.]